MYLYVYIEFKENVFTDVINRKLINIRNILFSINFLQRERERENEKNQEISEIFLIYNA